MHQKILWVVSALAAAALLVLFLWQHHNPSYTYTSPVPQPPGEGLVGSAATITDLFDVEIKYTDQGFEPSDITVAQGTRVRFLNNSNQEIWPASGIHPTHTLYPEKETTDCLGSSFDSCATLKKGEFYDFTFYYIGVWPYHDHLHAYQTGTITVTAN